MLDFYLIVSDYRAAYGKRWLALANKLIPPNVFYFEQDGLAAKYAVLSEADFAHECGPGAWTVSTAARFAQPSRLVWSADPLSKKRDRRQRCGRWGDVAGLDPSGRRGRRDPGGLVEGGLRSHHSLRSFGRNGSIARLRSSMPIPSAISGSACSIAALQRNTARSRDKAFAQARSGRALVAPETAQGKALFDTTASQGQRDLRRWSGLHHLEDQPPRGDRLPAEAVAAALAAARRDQPFAAAFEVRGGSLGRARAAETALASAPTVNGLRSSSLLRKSSLSPSPT